MSGVWKRFNEKKWDEPGKIYCDSCGCKNRSDPGWYRRERAYDPKFEELKNKLEVYGRLTFSPGVYSPIQEKEYRCAYCWGKDKVPRKCSNCKQSGHNKRKCPDQQTTSES